MGGFSQLIQMIGQGIETLAVPEVSATGSWLLVLVFVWSGTAKLRDPQLAGVAIRNFGFTARSYPVFGFLLGGLELMLALGMALVSWRRVALAAGAILLAGFAVLLMRSLIRGERFSCQCFGRESDVISWTAVTRTLVLGLLALGLVAQLPPLTSTFQFGGYDILDAVGIVLIVLLVSSVPKLWRLNTEVVDHFRNLSRYERLRID